MLSVQVIVDTSRVRKFRPLPFYTVEGLYFILAVRKFNIEQFLFLILQLGFCLTKEV